jgi:hypothetical protein
VSTTLAAPTPFLRNAPVTFAPLEVVTLALPPGSTRLTVEDARGATYADLPVSGTRGTFVAGGAAGAQRVRVTAASGHVLLEADLLLEARTRIDDTASGGRFTEFAAILDRTLRRNRMEASYAILWRDQAYRCFVPWILDHVHTAKGAQYISPDTHGLVDLLVASQRADGLVWSFARRDTGPGYYDSAYGPYGYAWRDGGVLFARQPVENHNEACFVTAAWIAWKGGRDDAWLRCVVDSCARALTYSRTDPARWSRRFELLKRGYTIDSWDFQVEDEYTVEFPLATGMQVDPERTKFGVFFGDNHAHAAACRQLAEMYEHLGDAGSGRLWRERADAILERLDAIAWNGRFFRHRVEEDPSVVRNLGVDEAAQFAMSNAYALNRGIRPEQARAILAEYRALRAHLPPGSPGEFYAIIPPFGRGFSGERWQYMNGGVHGHAAGELALGAFTHGDAAYGTDILLRFLDLGRRDGIVKFAYTGAVEPEPPPQRFETVPLHAAANLDLRGSGAHDPLSFLGEEAGNDLANLPVGSQELAGIPWHILDPDSNSRRAAVVTAAEPGFSPNASIPLGGRTAGALYLLHTSSKAGPSRNIVAATLLYADGTRHVKYLNADSHVGGWWFPSLAKAEDSGVAWRGPNARSLDVGVYWTAITNPHPEKPLDALRLDAALDGARHVLLALTLADRPPFRRPGPLSTGGPDNWSAGTLQQALLEGLAGFTQANGTIAFTHPVVSPRWAATETTDVTAAAHLPDSGGYVATRFQHDAAGRRVVVQVTGSGEQAQLRVLLPAQAHGVESVRLNDAPVPFREETAWDERYAVVDLPSLRPSEVRIIYLARSP